MNLRGKIMNSYYDSIDGKTAYVDVVVSNGYETKQYSKVPMLKIGGISTALPPVGALAIIGFIEDREDDPFLIGYMDSAVSKMVSEDDNVPPKPPTILTR